MHRSRVPNRGLGVRYRRADRDSERGGPQKFSSLKCRPGHSPPAEHQRVAMLTADLLRGECMSKLHHLHDWSHVVKATSGLRTVLTRISGDLQLSKAFSFTIYILITRKCTLSLCQHLCPQTVRVSRPVIAFRTKVRPGQRCHLVMFSFVFPRLCCNVPLG